MKLTDVASQLRMASAEMNALAAFKCNCTQQKGLILSGFPNIALPLSTKETLDASRE